MERNLEQLANLFLKFPGIGRRQAIRFAYFILTQPESYVASLARELTSARSRARTCVRCHRIFDLPAVATALQAGGNAGLCEICSNPSRDQSQLLIVEKSQDIDSFGKTDYHGLFFVLGGLIPIVQKNVLAGTNIALLKERVSKSVQDGSASGGGKVQDLEVILAFPITPNGEHTDTVVREMLAVYPISISSLGRGLSAGAELEYADAESLNASLKKRE
jgi:recombination protein RecR